MKAVTIHAARDLRIDDAPEPPAPGPNQVRVRIGAGGICGSDLHYYHDGGFGTVRVQQPMVLGHEVAGTVDAAGPGVTGLAPGDLVAVNPSLPCNRCRYCLEGRQNHCLDMRFYGSAMRTPHVDGGFRERLVCEAAQAVKLPPGMTLAQAAFAEPLAVCLHAVRQAGPLLGARVLVTGAGPIGILAMLAARHAGAREVVVTDIVPEPLALARRLGADRTVDVRTDPDAMKPYADDKGHFDVALEASGAPSAMAGALNTTRPGGAIVRLGIGPDSPLPLNLLTAKELSLRGTFRFTEEFALAVDTIGAGHIDVLPLLTEQLPVDRALDAFALAGDKARAMKVQLAF